MKLLGNNLFSYIIVKLVQCAFYLGFILFLILGFITSDIGLFFVSILFIIAAFLYRQEMRQYVINPFD